MPVIAGGISVNGQGTLDFGNYEISEKLKVKDFDVNGDLYSVKTHNEVTRLEKNGKLLVESVPGAAFFGFSETENGAEFAVCGKGNAQLTLELAAETGYSLKIGGVESSVKMKSSISGKINFSLELKNDKTEVKISKA